MFDDHDLAQFRIRHQRLLRAATRLLGARAEAEDAVQDTYLRALEAAAAGRPAPDALPAWLTTVMQRLAIDRLRQRAWMQRLQGEDEADALASSRPSPEAEAALTESVDAALRRLATRLSAAEGALVLLREVFEASFADIAASSGRKEASLRQQMHRALVRLRQRDDDDRDRDRDRHPDAIDAEALFQRYRQALQVRDAGLLFALLQPPPTRSLAASSAFSMTQVARSAPRAICRVVQLGSASGLVLTLGGRFVCVVPLGVRQEEIEAV